MIKRVDRAEQRSSHFRADLYTYIDKANSPATNVTVGFSIYSAGSKPAGTFTRPRRCIYVAPGTASGHARATAELEPGVAVLIAPAPSTSPRQVAGASRAGLPLSRRPSSRLLCEADLMVPGRVGG